MAVVLIVLALFVFCVVVLAAAYVQWKGYPTKLRAKSTPDQ